MRPEYSIVEVFAFCIWFVGAMNLLHAIWPLNHPLFVGAIEMAIAAALFIWWRIKSFKIENV